MEQSFEATEAHRVRHALRAGDVDGALACLRQAPAEDSGAVWLHVGRWAAALGVSRQARDCFARSAELDPALGSRALKEMARLAHAEGAHREEARALAAAWQAESQVGVPASVRGQRLAEIGFAYLRARGLLDARGWLEQAVQAAPERWDARSALVRLAGEDEDRAALERWVASAPEVPPHASGWWTARGEAARACRDPEAAARHFEAALEADPEVLDAAEHLVRLGVELGQETWIDLGLAALRQRCLLQGALDRAFVAAALEVGRGSASLEARRTYRSFRVALSPRLRAGNDAWVRAFLGATTLLPTSAARPSIPPAPLVPWASGHAAALEALARAFGLSHVELRGSQAWCVVPGSAPQIGVPADAPRGLRRARFWYGRALAALCVPGMEAQLRTEPEDERPSAAHRFLDRAGLVAALDPAVGLAEVGPHSPRGRALTGFAASADFMELWRVLGLGLQPPLPKLGSRA